MMHQYKVLLCCPSNWKQFGLNGSTDSDKILRSLLNMSLVAIDRNGDIMRDFGQKVAIHMIFDIASKFFEGHTRSLTLDDLLAT